MILGQTASGDHSQELDTVVREGWVAGKGAGEPTQTDSIRDTSFLYASLGDQGQEKKGHLLAISCRFGLWSAGVRLEPNIVFLTPPLSVTLSPSVDFSSTHCMFLFPLQTTHAIISVLLPTWLFLPAQHFSPVLSPGPSSGIQEEN